MNRPSAALQFYLTGLFIAGCIAMWGPGHLQAAPTISLPDLKEKRSALRLPFQYENGFIVVDVLFHHTLPLRFILDTGAEYTILTQRDWSDLLGFRPVRQFQLLGADFHQVIEADLIRGVTLEMGGQKFPQRDLLVTREDYFRMHHFTGAPIHGIIGADLLSGFVLTIDYPRREIVLHHGPTFRPPRGSLPIPIQIHRNKPYVEGTLEVRPGEPALPVKLLLDSGAALSLLLIAGSQPGLHLPDVHIDGILGVGLGGLIYGSRARIGQLSLGHRDHPHLLANFQEMTSYPDASLLHGRHGLMGNLLLEQYVLTIDYARSRLYLETGRKKRPESPTDRSGLFVLATGRGLRTFILQDVYAGSPAEEAGLRPGDRLIRVNGRPTHWYGLSGLHRILRGKEGRTVRLRVQRQGEEIKTRIILRTYI